MHQNYLELFGSRIKEIRQKRGLSQELMAEKCGLDRTFISSVERGKKSPSLTTLVKIAESLGVGLDSLFSGLPHPFAPDAQIDGHEVELPLMGTAISCGLPVGSDHFIEKKISLEKMMIKNPEKTFLVRSLGESMLPSILEGDILIVEKDLSPRNNQIVLAQVGNDFTVKRFNKNKDVLELVPDNSLYKTIVVDENTQICGVITGILRKIF